MLNGVPSVETKCFKILPGKCFDPSNAFVREKNEKYILLLIRTYNKLTTRRTFLVYIAWIKKNYVMYFAIHQRQCSTVECE